VDDSKEVLDQFMIKSDLYVHGAFALEQGFIFSSMVLAAATVAIIERKFRVAAIWAGIGALLCLAGLMHSYYFTPGDTAISLSPAYPWAIGYGIMAGIFLLAEFVT